MSLRPARPAFLGLSAALLLAACGGGGGGDDVADTVGGGGGGATTPPVEVTDTDYVQLSDRSSSETLTLRLVALQDGTAIDNSSSTVDASTGVISNGLLGGLDLDSAEFTNPANGEFTRVVSATTGGGSNIFGIAGLGTEREDRPESGQVVYNEGWIGVTAAADHKVYVLEGDATLTATFSGNRGVTANFSQFSGTDELDQQVNNVGNLTVIGASLVGFDSGFEGGTISGTGIFSDIDPNLTASEFSGGFFGPDADEVGGTINVGSGPVTVSGAFQAD